MNQQRVADERSKGPVDPRDEGARETLIVEEDFARILERPVAEFFAQSAMLPLDDPTRWAKRQCSLVAEKAHELESFLDDFDARHNRRFAFLVELVASIRGFAAVGHLLHHIRMRIAKYRVGLSVEGLERFHEDSGRALEFTNRSLTSLLLAMRREVDRLGLHLPDVALDTQALGEDPVRRHLPHDIGQEDGEPDEARAAAILSRYLDLTDIFARTPDWPDSDLESLVQFVGQRYDETKARGIESRVHNIQSEYDTHIKFTPLEASNPELRVFRGHISLALHLLEIGTLWVHFYERHEGLIQHNEARVRIAEQVSQAEVLRQAVLFALYHAWSVLLAAEPLAERLLPRFVHHEELELEVPEGGTLHARPLSLIVNVVRHHGTAVDMVIDGDATSAASIMGLILFAGRHLGARKVTFRGDRRPLEDLRLLFAAGLGEDGTAHLPDQLAYLRSGG